MGRPLYRDVAGTLAAGTYANPEAGIRCEAFFASYQNDVYIVKQRGATRYLVADSSAIQDESIVVGNKYIITVADTTDWRSIGAANNTAGTIFTATGTVATPQNGVVNLLTEAKLVSGTPAAAGEMRIVGYPNGNGQAAVAIKKLGKRVAIDFSGNRYTWRLVNDSTNDYIQLTAI